VRGARWSEIDLDAKLWTIPAERMKAGKEHRVPLSTSAVALLTAMEHRGGYAFPGRDKEYASFRYEPHGRFEAHGEDGHYDAWLSFNLPRLVFGVRQEFVFAGDM
jgi:integrase